jgi:hypothetical protein
VWVKAILSLDLLLLSWMTFTAGSPLDLPSQSDITRALEKIEESVEEHQANGDILFMDQRQLLTFGYIQGVTLIPEYEKKYVMDQAMAATDPFFREFYQKLADKKYALIVSEPLFRGFDESDDVFADENRAWVRYVSRPILCYYAPMATYNSVRVQLLVPRNKPRNCSLPIEMDAGDP